MSSSSEAASPGGEWSTVQSSKPRRLVPQFSLSRQNLGADNCTPSTSTHGTAGDQSELPSGATPTLGSGSFGAQGNVGHRSGGLGEAHRRRVVRYTREEMLTYRRPGRILPVMSNMLEVASLESLDPVCFEPFDPEDVTRIYAAERKNGDSHTRVAKTARSTHYRKEEDDGGGLAGDWSRNVHMQENRSTSLWDDSPTTGMDLEQFAAKALQFRMDMEEMKIRGEEDVIAAAARAAEEDTMERLIRDEQAFGAGTSRGADLGGEGDDLGGLVQGEIEIDEDDDPMPDWADDSTPSVPNPSSGDSGPSEVREVGTKRNLLMETLNVKGTEAQPIPGAQNTSSASQALSAALGVGTQSLQGVQHDSQHIQRQTQQQYQDKQNLEMERKQQELLQEQLIREQQHLQQQQLLQRQLQVALSSGMSIPAPPPPQLMGPPEWFYMDPQGQVQGPFSQENMRMWHGAGYFNAELPIKMRQWSTFHRFRFVFSDMQGAFATVPHEPGSMYAVQQVQHEQEKQRIRQQILEQQRIQQQQHQQQQALEEQRRKVMEEADRQKQLAVENERRMKQAEEEEQRKLRELQAAQQQAELMEKKRLEEEMQRQREEEERKLQEEKAADKQKEIEERRLKDQQQKEQQHQQKQQARPPQNSVAPWAKSSASNVSKESLTDIQKAEEERLQVEKASKEKEISKATSAWNKKQGSGAASLTDIQLEEEKRRQEQPPQPSVRSAPSQPSGSSGSASFQLKSLLGVKVPGVAPAVPNQNSPGSAWAVPKVTTGKGSSGSLKDIMSEEDARRQEEAAQSKSAPNSKKASSWAAKASIGVNPSNFTPAPSASPKVGQDLNRNRPIAQDPQQVPVKTQIVSHEKPNNCSSSSSSAGFGGKEMSREMAEWCAANLKRINGSEDITLMQFCMSLSSASEIREYIAEYLGSSPQIANFATEFIKYKEGGKRTQIISELSVSAAPEGSISATEETGFISASKKKKPSK